MLRLPAFTYLQPTSLAEALRMKADAGPNGMYVAGGTDLYPNMKRRHQTPITVISVSKIADLHHHQIGAAVTLTQAAAAVKQNYPALAQAIRSISTPILRNMGTIGGNVLLD